MIAALSLLTVLAVSVMVTRIASVALTHTGLSSETARFQARSAFTGVGFTTNEAETVVNHPVRRRILMLLMLLGNAGIVTAVSSTMLTFVDTRDTSTSGWLWRVAVLVIGIALLWTAAWSRWLDRRLSRLIKSLLRRWTDLDVRDYSSLLHLGGEYAVAELQAQKDDWLADQSLADLRLRDEGIVVLGIQTPDGEYHGVPTRKTRIRAGDSVLLYGRQASLAALDTRGKHVGGKLAHIEAVSEQKQRERQADEKEQARQSNNERRRSEG